MKKYEITYCEGSTINKKLIVEGSSLVEALTIFLEQNPYATYERVVAVEQE